MRCWARRLGLGAALLGAGCAALQPSPKPSALETARQNLDTVLRDVRAQEAAIREEMAKTRIAAAKQEADLKALRQQVVDLRQTLEAKHVELKTLRTERDRLLQVKLDQETQLAELARLRQTAMESAGIQAKLKELEATLAARTVELEQARKALGQRQAKGSGKAAGRPAKSKKPAPEGAPPAMTEKATPKSASAPPARPPEDRGAADNVEPTLHVADARSVRTGGTRQTVQPGDTLWGIAQQHGVTVETLKDANGLDTDVIVSGQELIVPASSVER